MTIKICELRLGWQFYVLQCSPVAWQLLPSFEKEFSSRLREDDKDLRISFFLEMKCI
jgi:hypothetical protein